MSVKSTIAMSPANTQRAVDQCWPELRLCLTLVCDATGQVPGPDEINNVIAWFCNGWPGSHSEIIAELRGAALRWGERTATSSRVAVLGRLPCPYLGAALKVDCVPTSAELMANK